MKLKLRLNPHKIVKKFGEAKNRYDVQEITDLIFENAGFVNVKEMMLSNDLTVIHAYVRVTRVRQ